MAQLAESKLIPLRDEYRKRTVLLRLSGAGLHVENPIVQVADSNC